VGSELTAAGSRTIRPAVARTERALLSSTLLLRFLPFNDVERVGIWSKSVQIADVRTEIGRMCARERWHSVCAWGRVLYEASRCRRI